MTVARAKITRVGSIDVEREDDGTVLVYWPGWVFEWPEEQAGGIIVDDTAAPRRRYGLDASAVLLGGRKVALGAGSDGWGLMLTNADGNAEERLRSVRVAVDLFGENGYSVSELAAIASDERQDRP